MTPIKNAALSPPTHSRVLHLAGLPAALRLVTSPTSTIVVGAAPWRHAMRLARMAAFAGPSVYILIGAIARIGESGDLPERIRRHRHSPPFAGIREIVALSSPGFGIGQAKALEAGLTRAAIAAGVLPVIGVLPHAPRLSVHDEADIGRWLNEIHVLLLGAGCTLLEADCASHDRGASTALALPSAREVSPDLVDDPAIATDLIVLPALRQGFDTRFPPDLLDDPATLRFVLERRGARATALVRGPWTVLAAGSLLRASETPSNQICLTRKRLALQDQGLLRKTSARQMRLLRAIAVPSLTNAARLTLGDNSPSDVWRPT